MILKEGGKFRERDISHVKNTTKSTWTDQSKHFCQRYIRLWTRVSKYLMSTRAMWRQGDLGCIINGAQNRIRWRAKMRTIYDLKFYQNILKNFQAIFLFFRPKFCQKQIKRAFLVFSSFLTGNLVKYLHAYPDKNCHQKCNVPIAKNLCTFATLFPNLTEVWTK